MANIWQGFLHCTALHCDQSMPSDWQILATWSGSWSRQRKSMCTSNVLALGFFHMVVRGCMQKDAKRHNTDTAINGNILWHMIAKAWTSESLWGYLWHQYGVPDAELYSSPLFILSHIWYIYICDKSWWSLNVSSKALKVYHRESFGYLFRLIWPRCSPTIPIAGRCWRDARQEQLLFFVVHSIKST